MRQRRTFKGIAVGLVVLGCSAGTAFAAMGDLDPGFSGDGKLVLDVTESGRADAVAIDSQGRIVAAGTVNPPGGDSSDFAVARFLSNGLPDTSFSGDGILNLDPAGDNDADSANAVAIDSAGRILVAGSDSGATTDLAVVRLLDSGVPDGSYGGGDGVLIQDIAAGAEVINGIALDSAGQLVLAGTRANNFLVARVTTAGALDLAFGGGDGFEALDVNSVGGNSDQGTSVAIDSAGRIVVAGYTALAVNQENFAVARFTPAGLLDTSFSNDVPTPGRNIVQMSSGVPPDERSLGQAVAVMPGDRVLTTGTAELTGAGEEVALLMLDSAGNPDASFSGDGRSYAGLGATDERANAVKVDASGRIVIAGQTDPLAGDGQFVTGRFLANGAPDGSFGGDGLVTTDVGPGDDNASGVALDRAGRIVAAGYVGPFGTAEWGIARYEGVPRCGGKIPTLTGTPGKDKLKGTKRKDVISGGAGKDTISGLGGADVLCGEDGKDRLAGGGGNDRLIGGKGNDNLVGGKGKDKLKGGKGKDKQKQ
jgi:uncharacterized delta-60 repeat protein